MPLAPLGFRRHPPVFRFLLAFSFLPVFAQAALAQEWRAQGPLAGFTLAGKPAGLVFECAPGGRLRTLVAGNGAGFPGDRDLTLVLSVDGTARLLPVRAEADPAGGSRFARSDSLAEAEPLLAALRRGRSLEVSSPAGRMVLPLRGSERALAQLLTRCGG